MKGGEGASHPGHVVEGVGHRCQVLVEGEASHTPEISAAVLAQMTHCSLVKETKGLKVTL